MPEFDPEPERSAVPIETVACRHAEQLDSFGCSTKVDGLVTSKLLHSLADEIQRLRAFAREHDDCILRLQAVVFGLKADAAAWAGKCGELQEQLAKAARPAGLDYWLAARRVRVRYPDGHDEVVEMVDADDAG